MGISERKAREKNERKKLIINCAKELISEIGIEKLSMQQIAERCELSKATLYLYFSGKEELMHEITEDSARSFIEYFKKNENQNLPILEKIKSFWQCYVEMFGKNDDMILIINMKKYISPDTSFIPLGQENISQAGSIFLFYNIIRDMIETGKKENLFDASINSDTVVRALFLLFSAIVENAARTSKALRSADLITGEMRDTFEIMLRGILAPGVDPACVLLR